MEESAKKLDYDKKRKKYKNKIHKLCDDLMNNIVIDNPEIFNVEDRSELINKVSVLESYLDDFKKVMAVEKTN